MTDYSWPAPLVLVENSADGKLKINTETLEELNKIADHVVVVGIVGLYRTGKSYLMNRLAGQQSGFDIGTTVQSKTKGIWIWCVKHPTFDDTCLVLLDTEGLDDVEKGKRENDVWIFALTILLSSALVYNSIGTIDQRAIDDLHFVTKIADHIKVKATAGEDECNNFDQFFPIFLWALRDFVLELEVDGKSICSDEYLEHALKLKPGAGPKISNYNMPRECIKSYFPTRKCFIFSKPVATAKELRQLGSLTDDQLTDEFVEQSKNFVHYIVNKCDFKSIDGKRITGRMLAGLTKHYVDAIDSGKVPCIESAVEMTAQVESQKALDESVALYREEFAKRICMPTNTLQEMADVHQGCTKVATDAFLKKAAFDNEKIYYQQLMQKLEESYGVLCETNERESKKRCNEILTEMHKQVSERCRNGFYNHPGGYQEYKDDSEKVYELYSSRPNNGLMADEVLHKFKQAQETVAAAILKADEKMSDEERKKEEEKRNYEAEKQRLLSVEEERRRTEIEADNREKSQRHSLEILQAKMEEENKQHQKLMDQVLEKRFQEERFLREEGLVEKADAVKDGREQLKKEIELKEKEEKTKRTIVIEAVGQWWHNFISFFTRRQAKYKVESENSA